MRVFSSSSSNARFSRNCTRTRASNSAASQGEESTSSAPRSRPRARSAPPPCVILLTQGGGAERARGLDLGADEVLSSPWEAAELLARVRVQLREKRAFDELLEKTRIADEGYDMAQTAFQALAVTEKMTRDAFSLGRALKIGVSALFAIAIVIAGIFLLFSRRANKEANRAYASIAQLERGAHRQEQLMADARR